MQFIVLWRNNYQLSIQEIIAELVSSHTRSPKVKQQKRRRLRIKMARLAIRLVVSNFPRLKEQATVQRLCHSNLKQALKLPTAFLLDTGDHL